MDRVNNGKIYRQTAQIIGNLQIDREKNGKFTDRNMNKGKFTYGQHK